MLGDERDQIAVFQAEYRGRLSIGWDWGSGERGWEDDWDWYPTIDFDPSWAAFFNAGQACEAGTRCLVSHKIYDKFMEALIEKAKLIQVGDTMDFSTTMGPIITKSQRKIVEGNGGLPAGR